MSETDFLQKLTARARQSFKEARDISRYTHYPEIRPEHLLLSIFLENGSLGSILLENGGFKKESLAKLCLKKKPGAKKPPLGAAIPLSQELKDILRRAYFLANQFKYPYVGTEHLVYALIESEASWLTDLLKTLEIERKKLVSTLENHLNFDHFPQLARMLDFPESFPVKNKLVQSDRTPGLNQFTVDLAKTTDQKEALIGREDELARLVQILTRKNKNNPLLIGEPGVGKTALAVALAHRIACGNITQTLAHKRILSLDLSLVVAGTNFRGEFEARLKDIIREATEAKDVILFIDEIHTIVGAGNTTGGLDAANILKPSLARGEIQVIGATTLTEYKRHIEKDPALERRFQSILVVEPSPQETKRILENTKKHYEAFHHITLSSDIIDCAVDLSVRYLPERFLPDKALDIIDEASALAKQGHENAGHNRELIQLREERLATIELKESLIKHENYDEAAKWQKREHALLEKIRFAKEKFAEELSDRTLAVERHHILKTVSHMTGIPFSELSEEPLRERIEKLAATFRKRLVGQQAAGAALVETLKRSISQVSDPERPLGSFLFLGPTGVGKTLAAKILAEEFFGDRHALIRLDMSEFMERHSVAQIIGAPAGYVGYGDGGKLTERIRRKPYSVVLFDEIEKAHPDVFNILLQILDEGVLTDAEGRKVSFKNALIILTSNIGTAAFTRSAKIGFEKKLNKNALSGEFEDIKQKVLADLKKEMRPELLARLDHILVFESLTESIIEDIAALEMEQFAQRMKSRGLKMRYGGNVVKLIAKKSFSPEQGARLVRKNIQELVEQVVANRLLSRPSHKNFHLIVKNGHISCRP